MRGLVWLTMAELKTQQKPKEADTLNMENYLENAHIMILLILVIW